MASSTATGVATNLLGRILTKDPAAIPGEPSWPVNDPMVFVESFPVEHKAEIVAVFVDLNDNLRLSCRTLRHGKLFTTYATIGHTVDAGK